MRFPAFQALAASRHSVRGFKADPVSRELALELVETAGRSASWCNVQPWLVRLVGGAALADLKAAMLAASDDGHARSPDIPFPREYAGIHGERRRESGHALYAALGVTRDDAAGRAAEMRRNFEFFGAPNLLVLSTPAALLPYALVDCGIFVGTFQLAAAAAGLGTIAQASIALHSPLLSAALDLPDDHKVVCGIAFGTEDEDHPANALRTSRAGFDARSYLIDALPGQQVTGDVQQ